MEDAQLVGKLSKERYESGILPSEASDPGLLESLLYEAAMLSIASRIIFKHAK